MGNLKFNEAWDRNQLTPTCTYRISLLPALVGYHVIVLITMISLVLITMISYWRVDNLLLVGFNIALRALFVLSYS